MKLLFSQLIFILFLKEYIEKAILSIWEMNSIYTNEESIEITQNAMTSFPDLRTDLLAIFLDENKYKIYKWQNEKQLF